MIEDKREDENERESKTKEKIIKVGGRGERHECDMY